MSHTYSRIDELSKYTGQTVTVRGWVTHLRSSGKVAFIVMRDGTGILQCVLVKKQVSAGGLGAVRDAHAGDQRSPSPARCAPTRARPAASRWASPTLAIIGASPIDYPIQPKEHGVDFLLDNRHLWLRSPRQVAIMRVRHEVEQAIHDFFYERGFIRVRHADPHRRDRRARRACSAPSTSTRGTPTSRRPGSSTARPPAAALGRIYTFGPTFRAEKSKTRRHLTEFWMIEPEVAFYDYARQHAAAGGVRLATSCSACLERRQAELKELERDVSQARDGRRRRSRASTTPTRWRRCRQKGSDIKWGDDLGAEDEALLVADYDTPDLRLQLSEGSEGLLHEGEPGRSAHRALRRPARARGVRRDHRRVAARGRLRQAAARASSEEGLPVDAYGWYLDLRKYGTFVHSGFGLGLERTVAWICGTPHIRECIAFPRMMHRLHP